MPQSFDRPLVRLDLTRGSAGLGWRLAILAQVGVKLHDVESDFGLRQSLDTADLVEGSLRNLK